MYANLAEKTLAIQACRIARLVTANCGPLTKPTRRTPVSEIQPIYSTKTQPIENPQQKGTQMSKKHFIELANLIKVRPHCFDALAIQSLADFCADQNPRFNRQRWLDYINGQCGPNGGAIKKELVAA